MTIVDSGLVQQFLDLLGVELTTATGHYVAFLAVSSLAVVALVSLLVLFISVIIDGGAARRTLCPAELRLL